MKALEFIQTRINSLILQGSDNKNIEIILAKEAIAELEALQQRSCESCRYWDFNEQGHFKKCFNGKGNVSSTKGDFCCNRYEPKEQQ